MLFCPGPFITKTPCSQISIIPRLCFPRCLYSQDPYSQWSKAPVLSIFFCFVLFFTQGSLLITTFPNPMFPVIYISSLQCSQGLRSPGIYASQTHHPYIQGVLSRNSIFTDLYIYSPQYPQGVLFPGIYIPRIPYFLDHPPELFIPRLYRLLGLYIPRVTFF